MSVRVILSSLNLMLLAGAHSQEWLCHSAGGRHDRHCGAAALGVVDHVWSREEVVTLLETNR
jgi:hypothetical protein